MTAMGVLQLVVYCVVLVALAKPLGDYMARVYEGDAKLAVRVIGLLERAIYRMIRVDPAEEMTWKTYALATLLFNVFGFVVTLQDGAHRPEQALIVAAHQELETPSLSGADAGCYLFLTDPLEFRQQMAHRSGCGGW